MTMEDLDLLTEPLRFVCEQSERLDAFLVSCCPETSRTKLAKLIDAGGVTVDGEQATKTGFKVKAGSIVEFEAIEETVPHDLVPHPMDLNVVYEDESLIVIDKPRGLATHPAATLREPSLVNGLLARGGSLSSMGGEFRPGIVHRLDKETTGLIVVAKNDAAHVALARQFEMKQAGRIYVGIVAGEPDRIRFDIDAPIARDPKNRQRMAVDASGKPALTHCQVLEVIGAGTLMGFRLSTGRTHQIRVHLRAIGHPILGDRVYAPVKYHDHPLQLHAAILNFSHPVTGVIVKCYVPPPIDFFGRELIVESVLANLGAD